MAGAFALVMTSERPDVADVGTADRSRELGLVATAELFWRRWVDAAGGGR